VRSTSTSTVNAQAGYRFSPQLPEESQPVADIHFHPAEPRTLRLAATLRF